MESELSSLMLRQCSKVFNLALAIERSPALSALVHTSRGIVLQKRNRVAVAACAPVLHENAASLVRSQLG
jgi:hypothetical protein